MFLQCMSTSEAEKFLRRSIRPYVVPIGSISCFSAAFVNSVTIGQPCTHMLLSVHKHAKNSKFMLTSFTSLQSCGLYCRNMTIQSIRDEYHRSYKPSMTYSYHNCLLLKTDVIHPIDYGFQTWWISSSITSYTCSESSEESSTTCESYIHPILQQVLDKWCIF